MNTSKSKEQELDDYVMKQSAKLVVKVFTRMISERQENERRKQNVNILPAEIPIQQEIPQ